MNKSLWFLLFSLMAISNQFAASQSAQVRLDCLSLRFSPATTTVLGLLYTLELGTAEGPDGLNGELTPTFDSSQPSHASSFRFTDPSFPDPLLGDLAVQVPDRDDQNANGFPDFFEVTQEVPPTVTLGLYAGRGDNGGVSARWSRAAGSNIGTCRIQLTSRNFGELPELTGQFELIEYAGTLQYNVGAT
ncbi:MAG: hypothetical protein L0Z50_15475, partial [Verrucomicrobiales bacterium]|nr:hypothetical protein [Verrucomicrobiales bacterium]